MAIDHDYLRMHRTTGPKQLRADISMLMLKGAAYGAVFFIGLFVVGYLLVAFGNALPSQSKEADDPSPWSFLIEDAGIQRVL